MSEPVDLFKAHIPLVGRGTSLLKMLRDPNVPKFLKRDAILWFKEQRLARLPAEQGD